MRKKPSKEQMATGGLFLERLPKLLKVDYRKELQELDDFYQDKRRLPSKINLSETENLIYDQFRIEFIIKATQFLLKYYTKGKSPINGSLLSQEAELLDGLNILNTRRLLEHIAVTIFNISGSVRVKYKHLLSPVPFTWETFEHLGGLMKSQGKGYLFMVIRNVEGEIAKRLMDEYLAIETTIDAALPSILEDDVGKLKFLFLYIRKIERGGVLTEGQFPSMEFTAIKALTRRVVDMESLIQLLKYTDNHLNGLDHDQVCCRLKEAGKDNQLYMVQAEDDDRRFEREVDLISKQGKHAALRRLELIGERITGKYLSSFTKDLDPSIDWAAFVAIRDVIAHQDESDNSIKIQQLLDDPMLFQTVLGKEMTEFFLKLTHVVSLRDKALPQFNQDPDLFWQSVYAFEKERLALSKKSQELLVPVLKPRASTKQIEFFMNTLQERGVAQEVGRQWLGVLDGTQPIPDKKILGNLLRSLPPKKESRALYDQCKKIVDQAVNPKTTLEEREANRKHVVQEAERRLSEKENKLSGMDVTRKLSAKYEKRLSQYYLTHRRRIEKAIEALENIKEFMERDTFIRGNFNFPNIGEWEKTQDKEIAMNFFARLITCPEFNDALEYNAAQLLQHLDAISKYPEAVGYRYIDKEKNYEAMRCLRNWVEHGSYLNDKTEYEPGKDPSILQNRQKVVGPIMITLIFELLPSLYAIREHYLNMQDICGHPDNVLLWRSIKTQPSEALSDQYDINRKWGPGYGF